MSDLRTSATHPIRVDFLPTPGLPGRVGMTFAPGKRSFSKYGRPWHRDLAGDLDRLVDHHGIHVLACLLEDHELTRLQIPALVTEAQARGLTVHRLPIPDGGVLPSTSSVRTLVTAIANHARAGRSVAIHCAGGLGRAGTVAGCLHVDQGMTPAQALATLHEVRSPNSPETPQQEAFVARFARRSRTV